jgi:predicted transcriptional regulator
MRKAEAMEEISILKLTRNIVVAHLRGNSVDADNLPALVEIVYSVLSGLGTLAVPENVSSEDRADLVRQSLKKDYLVCLECGKRQRGLKRHLRSTHDLTPQQYRERHRLPGNYPMVCAGYSKIRQEIARASGLGKTSGRNRPRKRGSAL